MRNSKWNGEVNSFHIRGLNDSDISDIEEREVEVKEEQSEDRS